MTKRWFAVGVVTIACGASGAVACSGQVLWSTGQSAEQSEDAGASGNDAGVTANDAGGTCQERAWPAMLAAPIVPLQSVANLNWNHDGPAAVTLAYAESVNCPSKALGPSEGYDGGSHAAWGPADDVSFDYGNDAPHLFNTLFLRGGYTGTLAFHSRSGGAFGSHQYALGVGAITRDGAPFAIDWTGTSASSLSAATIASVTELFDGLMATFAPTYPAESDCHATGDCVIVTSATLDDGGAAPNATFGFRPLKIYFDVPTGTSAPFDIYAFLTGGADLMNPPIDGGALVGADGGGGITAPAGCRAIGRDLWGSCEKPTTPLCGDQPGWTLYSCRDYPQSGFVATCCRTDGG
jgi:hypothetical protein